jgi:phage gpG-like protein
MSFTITVNDKDVQAALKALSARVNNMAPVLDTIGTGILERTSRRFETSTGADGVKWKNSDATLAMLAARIAGSKSKRKKDGSLNARGAREYANKKPLIDTGILSSKIFHRVSDNALTVSTAEATSAYAAIQQFGGKAGRGHKVNIPARPYLPIRQDGTLYPDEKAEILQALNNYLMQGL